MKYFTKEWYGLCCHLHHDLLADSRAAYFSDAYFNKLYIEQLRKHLELCKKYADPIDEPYQPLDHDYLASQGLTDEYIEKMQIEDFENYEEARKNFEPYDENKAAENFKAKLQDKIERLCKSLPEEILKGIADIRVFALDRATKKTIERTKRFCEINTDNYLKAMDDYQNYYKEASKLFDCDIEANLHFHDCKVKDIKQDKDSFTFFFDNKGGFTDIDQVTFTGYKLIKQDAPLYNAWWLYEEIYKIDDGYEIYSLLQGSDQQMIEFIIFAESISFHHDDSIPMFGF